MYKKAIFLIIVIIFALVFVISCGNKRTYPNVKFYDTSVSPIEIKSPEDNSKKNNDNVISDDNPTTNKNDDIVEEKEEVIIEAEKLEDTIIGAWWGIVGSTIFVYNESFELLIIKDNEIRVYRYEIIDNKDVVAYDENNKKFEGLLPKPGDFRFERGVILPVDNEVVKGKWREGPNAGAVYFDGIDYVAQLGLSVDNPPQREFSYNIVGDTFF